MITRADAGEIIALVTACHRRTAPRLDDRDVARATAATWADLFNAHRLEMPDLVAAVKLRATSDPDAPEPADIIHVARKIRRDRDAETGPTPEYEALCEAKAEDAAELAELRESRGVITENRPRLNELVSKLSNQKAINDA